MSVMGPTLRSLNSTDMDNLPEEAGMDRCQDLCSSAEAGNAYASRSTTRVLLDLS
jgi:hypothetical protein